MKLHIPIPYKATINYPSMNELKAYTETFRVKFMPRGEVGKFWHKFAHSRTIQVLTIGGIMPYFVVYAYPPEGFEIANPEDILTLELWRGVILELINYEPTYRVDTYTPNDGYEAFTRRKTELGY